MVKKMTIWNDICCVCVEKYANLVNISETDENNTKYQEKLEVCASGQQWLEEFSICHNCVEKLDSSYSFIQVCVKSEELRKDKIKEFRDTENDQQSSFGCDTCGKYFKLKRTLKLHITRIHNKSDQKRVKSERTECETHTDPIPEVQNASETNENDFLEHGLLKHEPDAVEDENYDDNNLDTVSNYSSDENTTKEQKRNWSKRKHPLKCEYCGKSFNRRQHWSAHIRAKHTFEKPYECDMCDAKYTNSHSLLIHKRNHNNEKPFVCSSCGKSFVCSGDLYHHSKIHLNKREYKCDFCPKSFNTTSILRTHKICMHTDPKLWKYVCSLCDRRFPINSSLMTHLKRHTGVKEFSCHICSKSFFDKSELTKHIRSHTNERLFKCNLCQDKDYKNRYGLRKHMKLVHDIGNIKITKPEKKFLCPMCPKVFAFNNKLQKHIFTHTGERPFDCLYCDKKFTDSYYRKVHLKKKHNVDLVGEGF